MIPTPNFKNNSFNSPQKMKSWAKIIIDYLLIRVVIIPFLIVGWGLLFGGDILDIIVKMSFVYYLLIFNSCLFLYELLKKIVYVQVLKYRMPLTINGNCVDIDKNKKIIG